MITESKVQHWWPDVSITYKIIFRFFLLSFLVKINVDVSKESVQLSDNKIIL
jgi:hypothetical protein